MFDQPTHLTRSYHSSRDTAPTRLYTLSLHDALPILTLSVSATTQPKRPGERDGVDYHFVTKQRFEAMVAAGELLEHAVVFGNRYGTPRAPVERALEEGSDILFDIDWQGTQQISSKLPKDLVRVFILPLLTRSWNAVCERAPSTRRKS